MTMLPKASFFKENLVVVVGVALPLLLVLIFGIARMVSTVSVDPPQFKAVYAEKDGYSYGQFKYDVDTTGKLVVTYEAQPYSGQRAEKPVPARVKIHVWDPNTGSDKKFTVQVPDANAAGVTTADTSELANVVIQEGTKSEDGYEYSDAYTRGPDGIMPEIFGYRGSYNDRFRVHKNGRSFYLPQEQRYNEITFIGWAKEP